MEFSLVRRNGILGNYWCGYVSFPKRPVIEQGYEGILTYVPVHGGITFATEYKNGMTYGFDCGHYKDANNLDLQNIAYLADECIRMALAIKMAAKYEKRYLKCKDDNGKKVKIIEKYHLRLLKENLSDGDLDITDNFGAMMNTIFNSF